MSLRAYIAEGGNAEDGVDGFKETVVYRVDGLTGDTSTWLDRALQADGLPARYQAHPSRLGAVVTRRVATPDGPDAVRVVITYSVPTGSGLQLEPDVDPGVVELGVQVSSEVVTTDVNGDPVIVRYDEQTEDIFGDIQIVTNSQVVEVERQAAQAVASLTRVESVYPFDKALDYTGRVNKLAVFGKPAGTWLCTGITARTEDRGQTYEVTYSFAYKPDGWEVEAVYIDDETNRPPSDLVDGYGRKRVQVQGDAIFQQLGVSF